MFLLPTLGPDTTSGDEDVAIHLIATRTLVFHRRIPCVPVGSFRGKHVLLRRAQPCQLPLNLMAVSLPNFAPFDVHADGNAGPRWKKWLARLERMFIGMNITIPKRKRALLLHYAGPDVDEIFDTLPNTGEDNDYDTAVAKLHEYISSQVNTTYEVYNFRQAKQKEGELLESYHTRLRQLAKTCEFSDIDKEIKEHIILTCTSSSLRRRALRENPTLEALLKLGRALELSAKQAKDVEDTGQIFTKMWQLWWICSSQKSVPSARKKLQHLRKN